MKPLFPNKDKLEETQSKGSARKQYRINVDCQYFSERQEQTGGQTVDGDYYKVPTDAGQMAVVWVANDSSINENLKYFCHGHTFGTYRRFGYSIAEVNERVLDEWNFVGKSVSVERSGKEIKLNLEKDHYDTLRDISRSDNGLVAVCMAEATFGDHLAASWEKFQLKWSDPKTVHSFRLEDVADRFDLFLESIVSSKNTFGHFEAATTIRKQLVEMYPKIMFLRFLSSRTDDWKSTHRF